MKRIRLGDLFRVRVDQSTDGYFQYVVDDVTQLSSQVVRVFAKTATDPGASDPESVAAGDVAFHAHVMLRDGLKRGFWEFVGHADPPALDGILFRDSGDYGRPEVKISRDWYVCRPNQEQHRVGALEPPLQVAEIGVVIPPESLIHRIRHGKYDFVYPDF